MSMRVSSRARELGALVPVLLTLATASSTSAASQQGRAVLLDQAKLAWATVHKEGLAALLATRQGTPPPLALVRIPHGATLEPHTAGPRLRFIAVVNGTLSYADGEDGDLSRLEDYAAGSVLMLPPDTMHFAAARHGDVLLLAVLVDETELTDEVRAQLSAGQ